jgi:hypothetical protein
VAVTQLSMIGLMANFYSRPPRTARKELVDQPVTTRGTGS